MTGKVSVRAPARLHLGFLDLNATAGRKFGSIGLAVDSHHTHIIVSASGENAISGRALSQEARHRLASIRDLFYQTLGQHIAVDQRAVAIELVERIPEHAGLGSGTQLALTLGRALARLHHIDASTAEIARQLGRGKRSGIGITTFDRGGFVVDGGLKPGQSVPPVLVWQPFPSSWRMVLILDTGHQGVHGHAEKQAFNTLPEFPLADAQAICHLTLMRLLPALAEQDLAAFGSAVSGIQALIGDHFASAQGGRYTSTQVAACLQRAQQLGHAGIAQSSWGPTGCVFVDSDSAADALIAQLQSHAAAMPGADTALAFVKAGADETGAVIESGA